MLNQMLLIVLRKGQFAGSTTLPTGLTSLRFVLEAAAPELAVSAKDGGQVRSGNESQEVTFLPSAEGWRKNHSEILRQGVLVGIGDGDRVESPEGIGIVFVERPRPAGLMRGCFQQIRMDGLIQLLEQQGHTGGVRVQGAGDGRVWFDRGAVVGASWTDAAGIRTGEAAFGAMVLLETGEFEVFETSAEEAEKNIGPTNSNMDLMLRACQKTDEQGISGGREEKNDAGLSGNLWNFLKGAIRPLS